MSRIEPVASPWSPHLQQRFDRLLPKGMVPPVIFRTVARNEGLFSYLVDTGLLSARGLMDRRVLPDRLRELIILRTCIANQNAYEFELHASTVAARMGLQSDEIEALRGSGGAWSDAEAAVIAFIDQLCATRSVSEVTWSQMRAAHDEATVLEVTLLCGFYTAISMVVSVTQPAFDTYR